MLSEPDAVGGIVDLKAEPGCTFTLASFGGADCTSRRKTSIREIAPVP